MGFVGLGNGANWVTQKTCQLVTVVKGNFVFDLKHRNALQTFYTFWGDFSGCLGRVSVGTTVNKGDMLDK